MNDSFAAFLVESLAVLERELPTAYREMCLRLAPREVLIEVDGELVGLRFDRQRVRRMASQARAEAVRVATARETILALLDGERSLVDAVLDQRLFLCGDTAALHAFLDGLDAYLHGAVRSPSFPALLERYRSAPRRQSGADESIPTEED